MLERLCLFVSLDTSVFLVTLFFNFILNVFLEVLDILAVLGLLSSSLFLFCFKL